jgi:hypothetical protein
MGIIRILQSCIQNSLYDLPPNSIVKLKMHGSVFEGAMAAFSVPALRALAPDAINIDAMPVDHADYRQRQNFSVLPFSITSLQYRSGSCIFCLFHRYVTNLIKIKDAL